MDRCRLRFFSTTGSSSRNSCRSVRSCDMVPIPPSYLYLLVALNISVYPGDIHVVPHSVTSVPCRPGFPAAASQIDDSKVRSQEDVQCSFGAAVGVALTI